MSCTPFSYDRTVVRSCALETLRPRALVTPVSAGRRQLRQTGADRTAA